MYENIVFHKHSGKVGHLFVKNHWVFQQIEVKCMKNTVFYKHSINVGQCS